MYQLVVGIVVAFATSSLLVLGVARVATLRRHKVKVGLDDQRRAVRVGTRTVRAGGGAQGAVPVLQSNRENR